MDNVLYIVLGLIGLFLVAQLYARFSAYSKKGKLMEDVPGILGKEINTGKKLLIYFYTNSCSACKSMTPVIDRLMKEFENIRKVNLATDMEAGKKFGIMGTPSTVLVENRKIKSFLMGVKSYSQLKSMLES